MKRYLITSCAVILATCAPGARGPEITDDERGQPILIDPVPDADGVVRILVYHDMEGLAGQEEPFTAASWHPDLYAKGRQMLTADVNAVIDGLFAGGADEVHVVDAHGSGSPNPDLLLDDLDPRAEMIFRDAPFRPYMDLTEPGLYDAVAVVGMHAKPGSGGFLSHTFSLGTIFIVNGMSITETEVIAYSWGRVGVPVIFASGDDKLEADLATMPWIEFVRVKDATSASTAIARPVDEARADLRAGAERAVGARDRARAMRLATPIRAALRVVPPARLDMLTDVPGITYQDHQVSFDADDFGEAYDGVVALMGVASAGYGEVQLNVIRVHPGAGDVALAARDSLYQRWMDFESGRWSPAPSPEPPPGRRYHGVN